MGQPRMVGPGRTPRRWHIRAVREGDFQGQADVIAERTIVEMAAVKIHQRRTIQGTR